MKSYIELYEKWLGLQKKKQHLRSPITRDQIKANVKPSVSGSSVLPLEPKRKRAEYVEDYLRPNGVGFYETIKCSCDNCKDSADRKWDLHNGMRCTLLMTSLPPPKRTARRNAPGGGVPLPLQGAENSKLLNMDPVAPMGSNDWTAEVVLLYTSLSTHRRPYHASLRAAQLLSCKGVNYWAVDANIDAGRTRADKGLIARWRHLHYVFRDPGKGSSKRDVVVPQVLVDGVPVGGYQELLLLEEEGDLDYILAGEACPNCLMDRKAKCGKAPALNEDGTRIMSAEAFNETCIKAAEPDYCFNCGAVFRKLLSEAIVPQAARKPLLTHCYRSSLRIEPCVGLQFSRDWINKKFDENMIPQSAENDRPRKGRLFVF